MQTTESLARAFLARRPHPAPEDVGAFDAALRATFEAARSAWPGVALSAEDYARGLAERVPAGEGPVTAVAALQTRDVYLALGCAAHDSVALEHFERDCVQLVPAILSGVLPPGAAMEEARQLIRQRLLVGEGGPPRIASYSGRGALRGWFRAAAMRLALNLQRAQRARPMEVELGEHPSPATGDAETSLARARHREAFQSALQAALGELTSHQRMLLRWHFFEGLPLSRIAELEGVSKATVSRWLSAARAEVLEGTRKTLQARLRVPESELSSLVGALFRGANATLADLLSRVR